MKKLRFLNKKETKSILKKIKEYYGDTFSIEHIYSITPENKIFIISKEFSNFRFDRLKINTLGLYIAKLEKDGIRLSIEGSQIIKPTKNILELNQEQSKNWLNGQQLEIKSDEKGYKVIKLGNDFLGTGKLTENRLINYIPKYRRIYSKVKISP